MKRYDDYKDIKEVIWTKYKIIVPTEEDRRELIEAFKHLHDSDIDTENVTVNQLVHEYLEGTNIIVDKKGYDKESEDVYEDKHRVFMHQFKEVQSVTSSKGVQFSIGDVVHIKRWYYEEGGKDFSKMGNCLMVDVKLPISKITIDETDNNRDTLWCGSCSTSTTDIANKGIVK